MVLAALALWLLLPDDPAIEVASPSAPTEPPPEILRPDAAAPEGELLVGFDAQGHASLALPDDAGVPDPEVERAARPPRRHLVFDACEEPLPELVEAPEGATLVHRGHVRVAFEGEVTRELANGVARAADEALAEAAELLEAEPREDLLVLLHEDLDAMEAALGDVGWATGVYDGSVHVMAESWARSLRHEVMHAQLHAVAPCVPYWLDEGLAAFFEHDPMRRALSWLSMLHAHMWIPFSSLEEPIARDEGTEEMEPREVALLYAQSLGMVALLDQRGGPGAIARAARSAAGGTPRSELWDRVMPDTGGIQLLDRLAEWLFPDATPEERMHLEGERYVCFRPYDAMLRCRVAR